MYYDILKSLFLYTCQINDQYTLLYHIQIINQFLKSCKLLYKYDIDFKIYTDDLYHILITNDVIKKTISHIISNTSTMDQFTKLYMLQNILIANYNNRTSNHVKSYISDFPINEDLLVNFIIIPIFSNHNLNFSNISIIYNKLINTLTNIKNKVTINTPISALNFINIICHHSDFSPPIREYVCKKILFNCKFGIFSNLEKYKLINPPRPKAKIVTNRFTLSNADSNICKSSIVKIVTPFFWNIYPKNYNAHTGFQLFDAGIYVFKIIPIGLNNYHHCSISSGKYLNSKDRCSYDIIKTSYKYSNSVIGGKINTYNPFVVTLNNNMVTVSQNNIIYWENYNHNNEPLMIKFISMNLEINYQPL